MKIADPLLAILQRHVGDFAAAPILNVSRERVGWTTGALARERVGTFLRFVELGLKVYVDDLTQRARCVAELETLLRGERAPAPAEAVAAVELSIASEDEVLDARMRARRMLAALGFSGVDEVKALTVVSELTRNILKYAGRGTLKLSAARDGSGCVVGVLIVATDSGPGIANLEEIMSGRYRSKTGMGRGLLGTKAIVDEFSITSEPGKGTRVSVLKRFGVRR